jgi:hypothetical protein
VSVIEEYSVADAAALPSAVQLADLEELLVAERRLTTEIGRRLAAAEATDALVAAPTCGTREARLPGG